MTKGEISEDFQIILAVRGGDVEAYARLVQKYHANVRSHCLSFLLTLSEADDAAQDVFVKAFASLEKYKPDFPFRAWLFRIASNHCLDLLRKRKRHKTDSLDYLVEQKGDLFEVHPSISRSEQRTIERQDNVEMALKVLSELSEDNRQILILREVDGLSYEEICATMGCSLDAVKARLHRARHQLQEKARHFLERGTYTK